MSNIELKTAGAPTPPTGTRTDADISTASPNPWQSTNGQKKENGGDLNDDQTPSPKIFLQKLESSDPYKPSDILSEEPTTRSKIHETPTVHRAVENLETPITPLELQEFLRMTPYSSPPATPHAPAKTVDRLPALKTHFEDTPSPNNSPSVAASARRQERLKRQRQQQEEQSELGRGHPAETAGDTMLNPRLASEARKRRRATAELDANDDAGIVVRPQGSPNRDEMTLQTSTPAPGQKPKRKTKKATAGAGTRSSQRIRNQKATPRMGSSQTQSETTHVVNSVPDQDVFGVPATNPASEPQQSETMPPPPAAPLQWQEPVTSNFYQPAPMTGAHAGTDAQSNAGREGMEPQRLRAGYEGRFTKKTVDHAREGQTKGSTRDEVAQTQQEAIHTAPPPQYRPPYPFEQGRRMNAGVRDRGATESTRIRPPQTTRATGERVPPHHQPHQREDARTPHDHATNRVHRDTPPDPTQATRPIPTSGNAPAPPRRDAQSLDYEGPEPDPQTAEREVITIHDSDDEREDRGTLRDEGDRGDLQADDEQEDIIMEDFEDFDQPGWGEIAEDGEGRDDRGRNGDLPPIADLIANENADPVEAMLAAAMLSAHAAEEEEKLPGVEVMDFHSIFENQCPTQARRWILKKGRALLATVAGRGTEDFGYFKVKEALNRIIRRHLKSDAPEASSANSAREDTCPNAHPWWYKIENLTDAQIDQLLAERAIFEEGLYIGFVKFCQTPSRILGAWYKCDRLRDLSPELILDTFRTAILRSKELTTIRQLIRACLRNGEADDEIVQDAIERRLRRILDNLTFRTLEFCNKDRVRTPVIVIYMDSPTTNHVAWEKLQDELQKNLRPGDLHAGPLVFFAPSKKWRCLCCHGADHPTGFCLVPKIKGWEEPTNVVAKLNAPQQTPNLDAPGAAGGSSGNGSTAPPVRGRNAGNIGKRYRDRKPQNGRRNGRGP